MMMLTKKQILDSPQRIRNLENVAGVYFLIKGDEIIYIGSSKNVLNRIYSPVHKTKKFDSFFVLSVENKESLKEVEARYVIRLAPRLNITVPKNSHVVFAGSAKGVKNMRINLEATIIGEKLYYIIPNELKTNKEKK